MSGSGAPAQNELEPGTRLGGRYRIVRLLGSGGMGAVYEGVQEGLGRRVALKVLHARLADAPDLVERFRREAQAAAALAHPHIVQVSDAQANVGEPPFLVMEFLDGQSLGDLIRQVGALPSDRVVKIAAQMLDGLGAAHRAGIVHRDIKPDNVFLAASSTLGDLVKLVDFGVAKLMDGANAPLTLAGTVIGTLAYMAPEQARGAPIDARTDLYAVAGCMYYALSRHRPLEGRQGAEMLAAIVMDEPPPLSQYLPKVDHELAAIVHRGLQKEPDARYPTADAMKDALTSWLMVHGSPGTGQPPPAAPAWSASAAATLVDAVAAPLLATTMTAPSRPSVRTVAPTAPAFATVVSGYDPGSRSRSAPPSPAHPSSGQRRSSTLYLVGAVVVLVVVAAAAVAVVVALRLRAPRDLGTVATGSSANAASVQLPRAPASAVVPASTLAVPSTSVSSARAGAASRPLSAQHLTTGVVPAAATKPPAPAASTSAVKLGRATSY